MKAEKLSRVIILLLLFFDLSAIGQDIPGNISQSDSAYYCSFFPMHIGDKWIYRTYYFDEGDYYFHYQIVRDTIDESNNKWFGWKRSDSDNIQYYSITDSFEVVYGFPDSNQNILFKLNAQPGDRWLIYGSYESGKAYELDTIYDYGSSKVMKIDEWDWDDYQQTLWISSRFLETNLGLVQVWWEGGPPTVLVGSIIDGIVWGNPNLIVQNDQSLIHEFKIFQNYPNPFNTITTITFSLPEASQVKTEVYDLTGRCVAVLCDRHYSAGTYSVQFDGSALASGIYIIRSQMTSTENPGKSQVLTRKMMLMK